ncbi:MAG TPA: single-stranded DNA-binding protein [Rectinemataceae bacterium]|nr:single-stranded DNA-binding protein [Rectinemataceae bacterium]
MNSLNSILVEGNLVKDPNTKTLPSGSQVCDFTLATNRFYKNGEEGFEKEVSYFDIEAWSRLGTACSQNLKKGRGVRVVGRLKQDRWVDPEGKQRAKIKIVAEHVEFKTIKPESKNDDEALPQTQEAEELEDSGRAVVF